MLDIQLALQRVTRLGSWLQSVNPYALWIILVAIIAFKSGFRSSLEGVEANFIPALQLMPQASSSFQSGPSPFFLAWVLEVSTGTQWVVMMSAFLAVALLLVVPLVKHQFPENPQFMLILLAGLPVLSTQFSWLGMYDPVVFLGIFIWFFARSKWIWALGALLAASGNPEQVAVAAGCALVISFIPDLKKFQVKSLILLVVAIVVWLVSQFWFAVSSNTESRAGQLSELLDPSIYAFSQYWPLYIWSLFGAIWVIFLLFALGQHGKKYFSILAIFGIGVPLLSAAVTLDGPRVLALIALPISLMLISTIARRFSEEASPRNLLAVTVVALVLIAPSAENGWAAIGPMLVDQFPWFPTSV